MRAATVVIMSASLADYALGVTKTWNPIPGSNNWNNGLNWDPNGEPNGDDEVVIDVNDDVELNDATFRINGLDLSGGAYLTTNGHPLSVDDDGIAVAIIGNTATLNLDRKDGTAAELDNLELAGRVRMYDGNLATKLVVKGDFRIYFPGLVDGAGIVDANIENVGEIKATIPMSNPEQDTLTVNGDISNSGRISGDPGSTLVFNGMVNGTGTGFAGDQVYFGSAGGFVGQGTISARIDSHTDAVITATGDLILGNPSSTTGFHFGGTLEVDKHSVTLRDSNQTLLGSLTNIDGGEITISNLNSSLSLGPSEQITGNGTVTAPLTTDASSMITVSGGNLVLGYGSSASGVQIGGTLNVGNLEVTLLDSNQAQLGASTTIGFGTIVADNGVRLTSGDTLFGVGTVDGPFQTDVGSTVTVSTIVFGAGLTLGDASSSTGVEIAGELHVGDDVAELLDSSQAQLGSLTTIDGGTIVAANGVRINSGEAITGHGAVNGAVSADTGAIITATGGNLSLGNAATVLGITIGGALNVGAQQVTMLDSNTASFSSGASIDLDGGELIAANGVTIFSGAQLNGFGTVNADVVNSGTIAGTGTLTFNGLLSGGGEGISGNLIRFASTGGFSGAGAIDARVDGDPGSTITATGTLSLGTNSTTGVNIDGTLEVGPHTVTLVDANTAPLGSSTTLSGGTLVAANGIAIASSDTLAGTGTVDASVSSSGTITVGTGGAGSLTIEGVLSLVAGQINQNGTGTLTLNDDVNVSGNVSITVSILNIDGFGTTNDVTTIAPGASLTINADEMDTGGNPSFDDTFTLNGGTLEVNTPDTWLMEGFLNLVNSSGTSQVRGITMLVQDGFYANSGQVNVSGGGVAQIAAPLVLEDTATVDIAASTQLQLLAETTINNATLSGSGTLVNAAGATLSAENGTTIDVSLTNNGTVKVGSSPGELTVAALTHSGTATLEIEIGGTTQGSDYDHLDVIGQLNLLAGSTLNVSLINDFTPSPGQSFEIVTYGSRFGAFGIENLEPVAGIEWDVDYGADAITLIAIAAGLAGDYNEDGAVDAADYTVWRDNLGQPEGTLPNDVDGGTIGQDQYDTWVANFGNTSGEGSSSLANAAVPEPASAVLLALATGVVLLRNRRVRSRLSATR